MRKLQLRVTKGLTVGDQWQAEAHIVLGSHATDDDGRILLSPDCVTASEVDEYANRLIKDLENIKCKAHATRWNNRPPKRKR